MSAALPAFIDPARDFPRGAEDKHFVGTLPLARMERLGEMLSANRGEMGAVAVELNLSRQARGGILVAAHLQAQLQAVCQRCLQDMTVTLDVQPQIGIVRRESQGEQLPEGYEPLLQEEGAVQVAALVEDELILAFPIVPMHPLGECPAARQVAETPQEQAPPARDNPFAVLSTLKGKTTDS